MTDMTNYFWFKTRKFCLEGIRFQITQTEIFNLMPFHFSDQIDKNEGYILRHILRHHRMTQVYSLLFYFTNY